MTYGRDEALNACTSRLDRLVVTATFTPQDAVSVAVGSEEELHFHFRCDAGGLDSLYKSGTRRAAPRQESGITAQLPQKPEEQEETLIPPTDVIKVYLEARPEDADSVKVMTDEVTHIQEVRYCLKTLREQMASRQNTKNNKHPANGFRVNLSSSQPAVTNGNTFLRESDAQGGDDPEDSAKLREATRRLYAQLKEMETRHAEEKGRLQAESREFGVRLARQTEQLQTVEKLSEERGQQVEELQRLLGSMAIESRKLQDQMAAGEEELLQLKADKEEREEDEQRCEELNKEVAVLKEKIHHLDDMLKCQQRKVRHMIEQLQNSRTVIQERDRSIRDLEERVFLLEGENREMHAHLQYFRECQESTEEKPEVVYSKTLTLTTQTNKALPFIKIIEVKSEPSLDQWNNQLENTV